MMRFPLRSDYSISRVIKGGWQLAGGHGDIDPKTSIDDMFAFCDAGINTFDCADIYTGVEELIGRFRQTYANQRGSEALRAVKVHTKCVPDLHKLATLTRVDIEESINTSLQRLKVEQLDLVQFHWWNYEMDRSLEVASWLSDLRTCGKIAHLGATNFDTEHMVALVEAGVPLVSIQVQYSLIDTRPAKHLVAAAAANDVHLICYGTVSGGLLSERWLGIERPVLPHENRSLTKYLLMVEEFGGWALFQQLLAALNRVAMRHGSDIASVASRMVLDRPGVAGVIVGARNRAHLDRNIAIATLALDEHDRQTVGEVLNHALPVPGDVYDLERDRSGPHGAIMKYNLNEKHD